jgi:hypothetical protein
VKISILEEIDKYDKENTGFILETAQPPDKLPEIDIQVRLVKKQVKEVSVEYDLENFQSPLELLEEEVKKVFPNKVDMLKELFMGV